MGSIIDRALDIINDHLKDQTSSFSDPVSLKPMARGGHVLEDDYPSHYLPGVGRQVMADGGAPIKGFEGRVSSPIPVDEPIAAEGVEAYHGSPHEFEEFDPSKIGTGEGAQVYGHGLYFAGNENIAKYYRDSLTDPDNVSLHFKGRPVDTVWNDEISDRWGDVVKKLPKDHEEDFQTVMGNLSQIKNLSELKHIRASLDRKQNNILDKVVLPELSKPEVGSGHMYEVRLDAHPEEHLLDWDKPLKDQHPNVIAAFNKAVVPIKDDEDKMIHEMYGDKAAHEYLGLFDKSKGSQAYKTFAEHLGGQDKASEALSKAGIRGIRYLDAGSRGQDEKSGSHNYVIFDPQHIKVKRRYAEGGEVPKSDDEGIVAYAFGNSVPHIDRSISDEYQGSHQSPGPENGAPLWRMHDIYPDDLYSQEGFRYYADFGNPYDREGYQRAISAVNQPSKSVTIYRAVPKDTNIKDINKGDWVTLTRDYAKEHGESALQGKYKILKKDVKARDLFTHGDSIHEFGYHPQPHVSDKEIVSRMSDKEAKDKLEKLSPKARSTLRKALEERMTPAKASGGVTAYHGSPHEFEEFDPSFIGTGEGAQAYGHGLYFAENEDVARSYRGSPELKYARYSGHMSPIEEAVYDKSVSGSDSHDAFNRLKKLGYADDQLFDAIDKIYPEKGRMYEVRLNAGPEHLLDWDKPLSEQHPKIQEALSSHPLSKRLLGNDFVKGQLTEPNGQSILNRLIGSAPEKSKQLSEIGIRGIRYLDAGSRGMDGGSGSHNYVIFDPKHIKTVRRYAEGGGIKAYFMHAPQDFIERAKRAYGGAIYTPELTGDPDDLARRLILWSYAAAPIARPLSRAEGGSTYPVAMPTEIKEDLKDGKAKMRHLSPQEFLDEADPLQIGKGDRHIINSFEHHIERGHKLGPLKLYEGGHQDGRHRANAAKDLGVKKVPVIDYRKADGGPVDDAQNAVDVARNLTPMGFYSAAAEAASKFPQKAPIDQIISKIKGQPNVKTAELDNANLKDAFAGQRSVDPQEVARHLQANVPQISEKVYGGKPPVKYNPKPMLYHPEEFEDADEVHRIGPEGQPPHYIVREGNEYFVYGPSGYHAAYNSLSEATDHANNSINNIEQPIYKEYTIPGGKNYREVVMHLPEEKEAAAKNVTDFYDAMHKKYGEDFISKISPEEDIALYRLQSMADVAESKKPYQSSHWHGVSNPLAHLRMSDRDNGKTLHLEELQSDWGQEGRKKGFALGPGKLPEGYTVEEIPIRQYEGGPQIRTEFAVFDPTKTQVGHYASTREEAIKSAIGGQYGVPPGPYVTDTNQWVDLGLKRALMEAAKGGYDKLIWTPGEQQAARYDLSKHIGKLQYFPGRQRLQAFDHDGNSVIDKLDVTPDQLPEHIGKEVAQKLLSDEHAIPNKFSEGTLVHEMRGQDLTIGGEGMKAFYDKLVPQRLSKLVSQYDKDAKVAPHSHSLKGKDGEVKAHAIQITPKLRAAILKGLPAFRSGGDVSQSPIIDRAFKVLSKFSR